MSFLIASVPGLTVLTAGWGVPSDAKTLFAIILEVLAFSVLALLILWRSSISGWSRRRVTKHLIRAGTGAIVLIIAYALASKATVHPVAYPERGAVLIPIPVSAWATQETQYWVHCAQQGKRIGGCDTPPADMDFSAADVATAISTFGAVVRVHHDVLYYLQLTILVSLYCAIVGSLIWLYGIVMIRRLDVRKFVLEFGKQATQHNEGRASDG